MRGDGGFGSAADLLAKGSKTSILIKAAGGGADSSSLLVLGDTVLELRALVW